MTNILIAGYYGLNNIGDEAILSGMMCSLNKYIDNAQFSVITNNPIETKKIHNVIPVKQSFKDGIPKFALNCVLENELYNIFKQIDNCDIFILGGGSLLQDLKIYYLPFLLSMVYYAQKKGKKTVVYGIGAGPIDTPLGKKLCRKILGSADLVTVRDPMSMSVLERCGLQNVIQTADPAFGLDIRKDNISVRPFGASKEYPEKSFFGTTMYKWLQDSDKNRNRVAPAEALEKRRTIISEVFSDICKTHNRNLFFIPTVKIDETGYHQIKNFMRTSDNVFVASYTNDLIRILSLISKSELLIGMRLHSLILASIMGVPIVPISYCGKVKSYLNLIGLDDLYLDVGDLGKSSFRDKLRDNILIVKCDKGYYAKLLRDVSANLRKKALLNAKLCYELI
jgi:polysaccharide pyruvyl transferase CsaB